MKWYKNIFKINVDEYRIRDILNDFIKPIETNIFIHYEVNNKRVVKLYTNRPGLIIGKAGKDINMLTEKLKTECNVKDVKLYEMKYIVTNCGIY